MGGRPKALLKLGGRRIIERVVDAVKPAVDDLLIVTNTPELYTFLGTPPSRWPATCRFSTPTWPAWWWSAPDRETS